ncbi:MAG: hypothetical protein PHV68_09490 [Candidatus Gastranaerophilales bacterium]|nr:hypothetical protein [Candidatus Gastranaerophilales bacterium]
MVCALSFADYDDLVGKRIEIHGPFCWEKMGVALDEKNHEISKQSLEFCNKRVYRKAIYSDSHFADAILGIEKNTKALVVDVSYLEAKAKVIILTGLHKGMSGWIPIEWLNDNELRPQIKDYL